MNAAPDGAAEHPRSWLGTLLILGSAIAFGGGTTMGRLAYDGGSNPLTVLALRLAAFVAIVGFLVLALRRPRRLTPPALIATLWMAVALTIVSVGYYSSVAFIPVSLAALILYSFPVLVGVIAAIARRDRMTPRKAVALLTAFAGIALALGPSLGSLDWRGIALAMLAALSMGFTIAFGGEALRGRDPVTMNFYTNLWMLIGMAAYLAVAGGFTLPRTGIGGAGAAGVCASYVVAFLTWFLGAQRLSPMRVAAYFNLEPLVSIVAAWLFLGERLAPVQLLGAALVLGSIAAFTQAPRQRAAQPEEA